MAVIASRPAIIPGTGLELTGATLSLTPGYVNTIAGAEQAVNRDQVSGYPSLDANSAVVCKLIPRLGTAAAMAGIVLEAGEFASTSDTFAALLGDGVNAGGRPIGLNSTACIVVSAFGTPTQNGQALLDAYTLAKTFQPNGSALSITNRCVIVLLPGTYKLPTDLAINTSFIDLFGFGGSRLVTVDTTTAKFTIASGSDHAMTGLRIMVVAAHVAVAWTITGAGTTFNHTDINWDCDASSTNISSYTGSVAVNGSATDCRSNGAKMYGGVVNGTWNCDFTRCDAALHSLGASSVATGCGTVTGRIRDCTVNTPTWNVKISGILERSRILGQIPRLVDGGRYYDNTFIPQSSIPCLDNNSVAANILCSHNRLKTFGGGAGSSLGTNVVNTLGTMAASFNLESDLIA